MNKILTEQERLKNFCIEADALSGVSYFDIVNAGLEPVKYHYPVESRQKVLGNDFYWTPRNFKDPDAA